MILFTDISTSLPFDRTCCTNFSIYAYSLQLEHTKVWKVSLCLLWVFQIGKHCKHNVSLKENDFSISSAQFSFVNFAPTFSRLKSRNQAYLTYDNNRYVWSFPSLSLSPARLSILAFTFPSHATSLIFIFGNFKHEGELKFDKERQFRLKQIIRLTWLEVSLVWNHKLTDVSNSEKIEGGILFLK